MKIVSSKPIVVRSRSEKKVDKLVIDKVLDKPVTNTGRVSSIGLVINLLNGDEKLTKQQIVAKVKSTFKNLETVEIEKLIKEYE